MSQDRQEPTFDSIEISLDVTTPTILVIDDDEATRDLIGRYLSGRNYRVLSTSIGREGLELLDSQAVDLVLLDVLMPDLDGIELLGELRKRYGLAELPVIMATGLDSSSDVIKALRAGANDYVTKPIDLPLIEARVETQLALKRVTDQVKELNRQLEEANERIVRLVGSTSTALTDMAAWTAGVAQDMADAVEVREIAAFAFERERLEELCNVAMTPPRLVDLALILGGQPLERDEDTVLPVLGYSDDLLGALVVPGKEVSWAPKALSLLEAFARQLGGALEMQQIRGRLADQEEEVSTERTQDSFFGIERIGAGYVQVCHLCGRCFNEHEEECPECGPGAMLHSPVPVPYELADRYRLVQVLGKGGMGVVFSAEDERLDREVAIKVINPEYLGRRTAKARFKQEARAVAAIQHPGVVAVYDFGEVDNGAFYIVMERLFGLDLEHLIKRCGPGRPSELSSFLIQGAAALDAAHEAQIIHRDLKPGNFVLCPTQQGFRVKILDFGLARRLTVRADLTRAGTIVGTPLYMSPEQAMGRKLDHRSDLYSFAAVAFRALSGHPVSEHKSYAKILEDVVRNPPPSISTYLGKVPRRLDRSFARALAKKPADRPRTALSWASAVAEVLDQLTLSHRGWRTNKGLLGVERPAERS